MITERSIIFLAVTGEEQGLLGSEYYASHPIFPLNKTVANLNMDALGDYGETNDFDDHDNADTQKRDSDDESEQPVHDTHVVLLSDAGRWRDTGHEVRHGDTHLGHG